TKYYKWIEKKSKEGIIPIIDHLELDKVKEIGKGGHGTVYSAEYRGAKIVFKEIKDKDNVIRKIVNEVT
ncbi:1322_t:CDS:2, partial [Gigaspora margarita]